MAKENTPKKKVVVSKKKKTEESVTTNKSGKKKVQKTKVAPTVSRGKNRTRGRSGRASARTEELIFDRQNFIWMGIGLALLFLGMALMAGGHMPSDDVWDDNIIYGFRRTVLAPILILGGLAVEIYAIFKKS